MSKKKALASGIIVKLITAPRRLRGQSLSQHEFEFLRRLLLLLLGKSDQQMSQFLLQRAFVLGRSLFQGRYDCLRKISNED